MSAISEFTRAMVPVLLAAVAAGAAGPGDTPAPVDSSNQIAARIIDSKVPVLVDFWAPWCGPCRMVTPALQQIAKEYKGRATLVKVNIDIHRRISAYFGVVSIPAVYIVRNKVVRAVLQGAQAKEEYKRALDGVLAMKDTPPDSAAAPKPAAPQPVDSAKADSSAAGGERTE